MKHPLEFRSLNLVRARECVIIIQRMIFVHGTVLILLFVVGVLFFLF